MRFFLLSAASLVLVAGLTAQNGPRRPGGGDGDGRPDRGPRIEQLAEFLELSPEQVQELGAVMQSRAEAMRENMQMIREKQRAANEEMKSENPDPTLIGQLLLEARALQGAVRDRNDEFVAAAQDVLDDIQRAKLSSLERMVPFQAEIRQAQMLGLLANEEGNFRLGGGFAGPGRRGPGGPGGRGGRRPGGRPGPGGNNQ